MRSTSISWDISSLSSGTGNPATRLMSNNGSLIPFRAEAGYASPSFSKWGTRADSMHETMNPVLLDCRSITSASSLRMRKLYFPLSPLGLPAPSRFPPRFSPCLFVSIFPSFLSCFAKIRKKSVVRKSKWLRIKG